MKPFLIRLLAVFVLSAAITGYVVQQSFAQTPIPEQELPLPEFFGLYAVDQGKTIPLKDIQQWTGADVTSNAEFIMYDHTAADKTVKAILNPFLLDPAVSMSSKGFQWDEQHTERVPGAPKGFRSYGGGSRIELLRKPVANHPDMIRLVPAVRPEAGFYTLALGAEGYGIWIDRGQFEDRIAKVRKELKTAMSDPLMSKKQIAYTVIDNLGTLRRRIDEIGRTNNLPKGATVSKALLARQLAGASTDPLIDPLGNEYGEFVVGQFPSVSSATKQNLAQLGDWKEFEVLLAHPWLNKARRAAFDGYHLACEHCKQAFSVRDNLRFDLKESRILPFTFYISTIECPLCHKVTSAEWGYLHGL